MPVSWSSPCPPLPAPGPPAARPRPGRGQRPGAARGAGAPSEPRLHARGLSVASAQHALGESGGAPFRVCQGAPLGREVRPPGCPRPKPPDLCMCHHTRQRGIQVADGTRLKIGPFMLGRLSRGAHHYHGDPCGGGGRQESSRGSETARQGQGEAPAAGRGRGRPRVPGDDPEPPGGPAPPTPRFPRGALCGFPHLGLREDKLCF